MTRAAVRGIERPAARRSTTVLAGLRHRARNRLRVRRLAVAALAALSAWAVPARLADTRAGTVPTAPSSDGAVVEGRQGTDNRFGLQTTERAVAIGRPLAALPLQEGDIVELVAVTAATDGGVRHQVVTDSARVVDIGADSTTLAVARELAPEVLELQAVGSIELILTPW